MGRLVETNCRTRSVGTWRAAFLQQAARVAFLRRMLYCCQPTGLFVAALGCWLILPVSKFCPALQKHPKRGRSNPPRSWQKLQLELSCGLQKLTSSGLATVRHSHSYPRREISYAAILNGKECSGLRLAESRPIFGLCDHGCSSFIIEVGRSSSHLLRTGKTITLLLYM